MVSEVVVEVIVVVITMEVVAVVAMIVEATGEIRVVDMEATDMVVVDTGDRTMDNSHPSSLTHGLHHQEDRIFFPRPRRVGYHLRT